MVLGSEFEVRGALRAGLHVERNHEILEILEKDCQGDESTENTDHTEKGLRKALPEEKSEEYQEGKKGVSEMRRRPSAR